MSSSDRYMVIFRPQENEALAWKQWNSAPLTRVDQAWEAFLKCREAHPGSTIRIVSILESLPPWH